MLARRVKGRGGKRRERSREIKQGKKEGLKLKLCDPWVQLRGKRNECRKY